LQNIIFPPNIFIFEKIIFEKPNEGDSSQKMFGVKLKYFFVVFIYQWINIGIFQFVFHIGCAFWKNQRKTWWVVCWRHGIFQFIFYIGCAFWKTKEKLDGLFVEGKVSMELRGKVFWFSIFCLFAWFSISFLFLYLVFLCSFGTFGTCWGKIE